MKQLLTTFLFLLLLSPAWAEPAHEPGPYSVKTLEYPDLIDSNRRRKVPMKLYWGEKSPKGHLIVISHGGGGNWDSYYALASHLASHGFVVICPEHVRSNTKHCKKLYPDLGLRGTLKFITRNPESNLQRPKDIGFVIDQSEEWNSSHPELCGKIRTDRVGLMGHSFGAYTTMVVCGARPLLDYLPNSGTGLSEDLSDPRVAFGLALSPQAPGEPFFSDQSYRTINRPLIGMSGTRDKQQGPTWRGIAAADRKKAFRLWPAGDKVFVWLKNADHFSFADATGSGRLIARWMVSEARDDTTRIVKATALLASRIHLKKDQKARREFRGGTMNALCGRDIPSLEWLQR